MEAIKDILFSVLVIVALAAIILTTIWWVLELLNRIFNFSRYIIMYHNYKRHEKLFDLKNHLIISKDGMITYTCVANTIEEQEAILYKALRHCADIKKLRDKYS